MNDKPPMTVAANNAPLTGVSQAGPFQQSNQAANQVAPNPAARKQQPQIPSSQITTLEKQIEVLWSYLKMNVERKDLHSIWDCAIDIQVLYGKLEVMKK